jgi:hypothetical protein
MSKDDGATGLRISFEAMLGQLASTMGSVTEGLDRIHKFMSANPIRTPLLRPVLGSYVAASSALTYGFMDCGGPPAGFQREIRWFVVYPPDPTVALATAVCVPMVLGAGQYQDTATEPTAFTQVAGVFTTMPAKFIMAHNELTLQYPQHLFIMFKALANNQQINCFGQAWDYDISTRVSEPL